MKESRRITLFPRFLRISETVTPVLRERFLSLERPPARTTIFRFPGRTNSLSSSSEITASSIVRSDPSILISRDFTICLVRVAIWRMRPIWSGWRSTSYFFLTKFLMLFVIGLFTWTTRKSVSPRSALSFLELIRSSTISMTFRISSALNAVMIFLKDSRRFGFLREYRMQYANR